MSESKFIMEKKLHNVKVRLMRMDIQDFSIDNLTSLVLKECIKEDLTFRFSFVEDACVLNIRNLTHEDWEINPRVYYNHPLFETLNLDDIKVMALKNTFLLTPNEIILEDNEASSDITKQDSLEIISGDKPMPSHISKAIEKIQAKGIPVTIEAIKNHLPRKEMSNDSLIKCNRYLNEMETQQ